MGISTAIRDPRVADVHVSAQALTVKLRDGRVGTVQIPHFQQCIGQQQPALPLDMAQRLQPLLEQLFGQLR